MSKEKRKVRNKARDVFTDYYKSNRQYDEENRRRQAEQEKTSSWSGTEKLYLAVIIAGIVGIVIKYVIL